MNELRYMLAQALALIFARNDVSKTVMYVYLNEVKADEPLPNKIVKVTVEYVEDLEPYEYTKAMTEMGWLDAEDAISVS